MRRVHQSILGDYQPAFYTLAATHDAYALGGASHDGLRVSVDGEVHALPHFGQVLVAAFSPSGRWLATGSWDMGVRIFDADGKLHQLCKGHYNQISALLWLDDDTLLSASTDGRVARFEPDTERPRRRSEPLPHVPLSLAPHPDGVVVGAIGSVVVLSRELDLLRVVAQHGARSITSDGTLIATRHHDRDAKTDVVSIYDGMELRWSGEGGAVAIHERLVAIGSTTGDLCVRRADGSVLFEHAPHDAEIETIAVTPWGWLTGARDGLAQVTSFDGEPRGGIRHRTMVRHAAMLGERAITAGADAEVALWTLDDLTTLARPRRPEPARVIDLVSGAAVAFGDGSLFGVSTTEGFHVFDRRDTTRHDVFEPDEPHWYAVHGSGVWGTRIGEDRTLALMRESGTLAKVDGFYAPQIVGGCVLTDALECFRLDDMKSLARETGNIHGCSISPSGRWAWLATDDGSVCVEVESGDIHRAPPSGKSAFSHDDAWVAYTTNDAVVLRDVATGRTRHRIAIKGVWSLVWSPVEARIAIGTMERVVHLVDAESGRIETTLKPAGVGPAAGYTNPVWCPDGARVAVGSQLHKGALFELDGTRVTDFEGIHSGFIRCDIVGDRILVYANVNPCPDFTLQLWTFEGDHVANLPGHQGQRFWQVNPSSCGRWVASLVDGDRVRVWSTADGACSILPVVGARGADFGDDVCVTVEPEGRVCVFELGDAR